MKKILNPDLVYLISLTRVPQIGPLHARALLRIFGTAEAVFRTPVNELEKLEGIGPVRARSIRGFRDFSGSEKEIRFLERYRIRALSLSDPGYPQRLLTAEDAPFLLFYKGSADTNPKRCISVVGTRGNSEYGKAVTEKIIGELAAYGPTIVSGLAFGIDALAHRQAIRKGLPTIAVLAHGLTSLYPPEHRSLSEQILHAGGLLTEYTSGIKADKHRFPIRNRIVAGISDCTLVIETGVRGGSMITADLANGYFREVFAVPGRTTDFKSAGCNWLIRNNQAVLLDSAADLAKAMRWEPAHAAVVSQPIPSEDISEGAKQVLIILKERGQMHIDAIHSVSGFAAGKNAALMLELEMKGWIVSQPGRIYRIR